MTKKIKSCFSGHVVTHSVVGVGVGLILASLFPELANLWLGVLLIIVVSILDWMRK